jgi:hypothetical protein
MNQNLTETGYYLKWYGRKIISKIYEVLARFIEIPKLKEMITRVYHHRRIDLENPEKLNEKILWMEYHTDPSFRSQLTDKYEVRQYVAQKGYADNLTQLYGLYRKEDEIDFDQLPDRFVLKATHGCDMNYVCPDKGKLNVSNVKKRVHLWLHTNLAYLSLEMHYLPIGRRIICEEYLDTGETGMTDYKFHCSDGKVRFILVCRNSGRTRYLNVFDTDWNPLHVLVGAEEIPLAPEKPSCLREMIRMAEDLAAGMPFVRVDLYLVNDKIYFGELTFTPATGVLFHFTDNFLLEQGKYCTVRE